MTAWGPLARSDTGRLDGGAVTAGVGRGVTAVTPLTSSWSRRYRPLGIGDRRPAGPGLPASLTVTVSRRLGSSLAGPGSVSGSGTGSSDGPSRRVGRRFRASRAGVASKSQSLASESDTEHRGTAAWHERDWHQWLGHWAGLGQTWAGLTVHVESPRVNTTINVSFACSAYEIDTSGLHLESLKLFQLTTESLKLF